MPVRSPGGFRAEAPGLRVRKGAQKPVGEAFRLSGARETESRDFKGGFRKTTGRKCDKERQENRKECDGPHSNI